MKNEQLFQPMTFGKFRLKNRIVLAPMTRGRSGNDRVPNELMAEYYFQRSTAGLLITEATVISAQGIGWIDSPGIYTQDMVKGMEESHRETPTNRAPHISSIMALRQGIPQ